MASLNPGFYRGGSITTANQAQEVAAGNGYRKDLTFQNTSDTNMWVTEHGVPAAVGLGYLIAPGAAINVSTGNAISVFCASAGKTFCATEIG